MANRFVLKFKNLLRKIPHLLESLKLDEWEAAFIRHNKKIWRNFTQVKEDGEILVESYDIAASIIAFGYFANALAKKHNARIKVYAAKLTGLESKIYRWNNNRKYKSFNAVPFYCELSKSQLLEVEKLFSEIYPTLKTKRDVENLKVEGLWIGDLLYDSYLMRYRVPTIEIQSKNFQSSLRKALDYYIYWRDYFNSHHVKAVIASHCVYSRNAIILRIAVQRAIPAYQVNAFSLYRLTPKRLWAYNSFSSYPEWFKSLSPREQQKGLALAKERIERRFAGEVGVDMLYSTRSAFVRSNNKRVIRESPRIKVLIAAHCFFDAPHPYGVNLFPDSHEWLTFLGNISEKTDYDWYVKTHPDFLPGNAESLENIICNYPKITLIPKETSHLQIIEEGIDFVLTVYGTVGFEYAALGVTVINASLCNPHIGYNFNIHPRTIEEYENILLNLKNQKRNMDINEVYEYYYMHYLYDKGANWLVDDFINRIGGYNKQRESAIYKLFLDDFTVQRHEKIMKTLANFIESGDFCFRKKHYSC
ncbi:MAG: hypothetical protein PHY02_04680 [Phycisphaerae bacterium]|nr:hypothetical protein [Phycisphaerae bacterium]